MGFQKRVNGFVGNVIIGKAVLRRDPDLKILTPNRFLFGGC